MYGSARGWRGSSAGLLSNVKQQLSNHETAADNRKESLKQRAVPLIV
jgi:hypothetical protein